MATSAYQSDPIDVMLAAIPSLPRALLDRLTVRMIERLDEIDGDPDFQQSDGDELDGSGGEEDFCDHSGWKAEAGCPVADPGEEDDPGGGNVDDEGEPTFGIGHPAYGIDHSKGPLSPNCNEGKLRII